MTGSPFGSSSGPSRRAAERARNSAISAVASAAAAGVASGRLVITDFAQLATDFVYADADENQQEVAAGDVVVDEKTGNRWEVLASDASEAHLDYTGAGGAKYAVLPADGAYSLDAFSGFTGSLTGSRDDAALMVAVAAAQGKALQLGAGPYDFSSWPSGLDDVHVIGTPFTKFNNFPLPIFNGVFTGNKQIAVVAGVLRYYLPEDLDGSGYVDGETVTLTQQGNQTNAATATIAVTDGAITGITLVSGGAGYITGVVTVVGASSSNGRARVSTVNGSGAITSLTTTPAGWYMIADLISANHDPVLLGPITASGTGSINLDVDLNEFGIDPTIWTPGGFVCGPDEGFVADGVIFGASVGTESVTITGSFTGDRTSIMTWTTDGAGGGALTGTNHPYILTTNADGIVSGWTGSGANRVLRLYREPLAAERKAYNANSMTPMLGCRRSTSSIAAVFPSYKSTSTTTVGANVYRYIDVFVDSLVDGSQITDATNQSFAITVSDPMARSVPFTFDADPAAGSNIWIVGVFTKKAGDYPA